MNNPDKPANHHYGVILAGGRGTRFWPRSRRQHPKQLMELWGGSSLLQQTVDRLSSLIPLQNVWVFTSESLAQEVHRQLPEIPRFQVIAEPVQRNTAPCAGLAAELISLRDPEAVLGVFPSDHAVLKPAAFRKVATLAFRRATLGEIVVLGIRPRWPETGYGYMEFAEPPVVSPPKAIPVKQFREKPNIALARRYVRAKRYFWNSGMFFWKASVIRAALHRYLPKTAEALSSIATRMISGKAIHQGGSRNLQLLLKQFYPACENISVDYAVLEKTTGVVGIPCEIGWNDMGSWRAVYDLLPRDNQGNVLRSEALLVDSGGLYVDAPGRLVGAVGVNDLVIVETGDALLVVRRDRAQDVSRLVNELEKSGRKDLL